MFPLLVAWTSSWTNRWVTSNQRCHDPHVRSLWWLNGNIKPHAWVELKSYINGMCFVFNIIIVVLECLFLLKALISKTPYIVLQGQIWCAFSQFSLIIFQTFVRLYALLQYITSCDTCNLPVLLNIIGELSMLGWLDHHNFSHKFEFALNGILCNPKYWWRNRD